MIENFVRKIAKKRLEKKIDSMIKNLRKGIEKTGFLYVLERSCEGMLQKKLGFLDPSGKIDKGAVDAFITTMQEGALFGITKWEELKLPYNHDTASYIFTTILAGVSDQIAFLNSTKNTDGKDPDYLV